MDEKKLISQLYCKIRNDNKTSKSIINDSYRKLKHNLCKIYKTMDVDFDSEMLKVMDEVIIYCSIYMTFRNFLSFDIIRDVLLDNYDNVMKSYGEEYWEKMNCQMFSKENIEEIKVAAFKSQYSLFKDDYLVYFVEGKDNISFGNNTLRCPIHIFCLKAGIYEFLEVLCDIDFIRSKYLKSGLEREKCLCKKENNMCTFRWKNEMKIRR